LFHVINTTHVVTRNGKLYTRANGNDHISLNGHGNDFSCGIPWKVFGCLEGVKINEIAYQMWYIDFHKLHRNSPLSKSVLKWSQYSSEEDTTNLEGH